jgi:ABC-2 type transport system ATP-binding protein
VSDLSVVELEVFGIDPGTVERLRALDFVDSIVVEQRELRQVLRIQTRIAERAVAPLIAAVDSGQVGRVAVREATLEDAYVRLVGRVE